MPDPLIEVRDLKTWFTTDGGVARAVDGVSFEVRRGETLGLVGESGCGKSVTSLSIMRLIQEPPGKILEGEVRLHGRDLLRVDEEEMRQVRGNDIAMIFQEPMTSLNPVLSCGYQIDEAVMLHQGLGKRAARAKTVEMLKRVGIPDPARRADEYPHRLSGGMRQRVMIAMALCCEPDLLIADEPTTALDVTIQAQILELLEQLQREFGMAVLMITHDLGVISQVADRVAVMYAGKIVEIGEVGEIFGRPRHPYTQGLLSSIPRLAEGRSRLSVIPGTVPDATSLPPGCRFHPRCPTADSVCRTREPALLSIHGSHQAACWQAEGYPGAQGEETRAQPARAGKPPDTGGSAD